MSYSSSMRVTRGGLRPATITNLNKTSEVVYFMFNPNEFTIQKSISWSPEGGAGQDIPEYVFDKGNAPTVSLTLHFDSQEDDHDVRDFTYPLWNMARVDESTVNSKTGKGEPPPVAFEWGRLYFKAIITQVTEKFALFDENGTPLRSEVTLSLTLHQDINSYRPQQRSTTLSSREVPQTKFYALGERLDLISTDWRSVASMNNINNPLRIASGTAISYTNDC